MIIAKVLPEAEELLAYDTHRERLLEQTNALTMEEIGRYINVLQTVQNNAKQVDNPRVIVEMGLLSLLQLGGGTYQTLEGRMTTMEQFVNRQEDTLLQKMNELVEQRPIMTVGAIETPPMPESDFYESAMEDIPHLVADETVVEPVPKTVRTTPLPPPTVSGGLQGASPIKNTLPPPTTKKRANPKPAPSKRTEVSQDIVIGRGIVNVHEYSTILANVIKWLRGHGFGLLNTIYQQGKLAYLDQERAILVFPTAVAVPILTQPRHQEDGKRAFQQVVGRPIMVEAMAKNDPRLRAYIEAAQGGSSEGAKSTVQSEQSGTSPVSSAKVYGEVSQEKVAKETATVSAARSVSTEEIGSSQDVMQGVVEETIAAPVYTGTSANSHVGAGSAPTNIEGIIDDFLTVYENPEAVLNPYYEETIAGNEGLSQGTVQDVRSLPKWSSAEASDEEQQDPLLYPALQRMEADGYDIYVEEVDETSKS